MKEERMKRTAFTAFGLALAVSAFACSNSNTTARTDADRAGAPPAAGAGTAGTAESRAPLDSDQKSTPVTLVGCLQKGDGRSDYILTEVNSTRTTAGTSGTASE